MAGCADPLPDRALTEAPPPSGSGLRAWPLIDEGDAGDAVAAAQLLLQHRGYDAPLEDTFSAATQRAVRELQRSYGLVSDGVIGPQTWEVLITWVARDESSPAAAAVLWLLRAAGHALPPAASFDSDAEAALRELQRQRCMPVTGAAGLYTWSALLTGVDFCSGGPVGEVPLAEVVAVARAAGLPCDEPLAIAAAIASAESGRRAHRIVRNRATAGCPLGSDDVGLWQINACYHPDVERRCALSPACSALAMDEISDRGRDFSPWTAYRSDAYLPFLPAARAEVERSCRERPGALAPSRPAPVE